MNTSVSIPPDWLLFARILGAILWSVAWAIFLQKVDYGQRLAERRAWISYAVGSAGVFGVAFVPDWTWVTLFLAFFFALIPQAARSTYNELSPKKRNEIHHTNMKRTMETTSKRLDEIVKEITALSDSSGVNPVGNVRLIHIVNMVQETRILMARARNGDYE